MNKGFFYYLHRSWSVTSFAYKRLGFLKKLELTLFLIVCYLGSTIFFLRPIFSIALMNMARMIEETHNLSVSKCFEGITKNSRFKELLIADLYVFFLVAVVVTLFFIPNLSYITGFARVNGTTWKIIMWTTISLASIVALIIEFKYLPLPYVASGSINTSAGDMLLNVRNMKKDVVWTEILLILFYMIIASIVTGLIVGGIIYTKNALVNNGKDFSWLIIILYFLLPLSLFFPMTLFLTMMHVSLYELYKDNVSLKKVYVVKEIAGTEVTYASIFPTEQDEVELIKEEKMGGLK